MGSEVVGFVEDDDVVERCPKSRYVQYNEILGKEASKTVYKGFDEVEGIEVAWSVMTLDDAMESPENIEICLLRKLKHDNIIKSYVSWVDDKKETVNMITELFYSGTLRQYLEKHKNVDLKAIKNWARQILLGLDYLHSHNPPIIHRDLKCHNIFVNRNSRQVKIGDLGFSTLMFQPTVQGIIGTQEFMAREVYEDEYNELVDIYTFGMCILELITCEYPYSECTNRGHIYKKISSGKKPASHLKVKDSQVKEFIEICLVPAFQRLSAEELLKDPFFSLKSIKESVPEPVKDDLVNLPKPDSCLMHNKMSCVGGSVHTSSPRCTTVEVERENEENYIWVKGEKNENDNNVIVVTFRIDYFIGGVKTLKFLFYLDVDTARTVALGMIDQQVLLKEDVDTVAEMLDCLIKQFEPL